MSRSCSTLILAFALTVPSRALAQAVPFSDQLAQAPQLKPPSRGSVAGQYAATAFGPGDVDRGTFALSLPIDLPAERGTLGASPIPSYSADGALSEWGAGWSSPNLSIVRSRVLGDIDFATDERTGPWGRMLQGTDGAWYPDGMKTAVRVVPSDDDLIAYLPDGSVWTFDGTQGVVAAGGTYSWALVSVVSAIGRTTTYAYAKNASGRPFVSTITYGGTDPATPQYEIAFDYATIPVPLVDYRSGEVVLLDRRVTTAHVRALDAGAFTERHTWSLGYLQDPTSPTFYLQSLTQTFAASGQTAPTVTYSYELAASYFATARTQAATQLDPVLQTYGVGTPLPSYSSQVDIDLDGRTDLEVQFDYTLLQHTGAGYAAVPLPAPTSTANPLCRQGVSKYNMPRNLARMMQGSDNVHVVALQGNTAASTTTLVLCDRPGETLWQTSLPGNWALGPNTRLSDLNNDHAPDLVRVYSGGYQAIPNLSTSSGFALGATVTGVLTPPVAMNTTWVHDLNGDGIPDLLARYSGGLVAWLGKGHLLFNSMGIVMPILASNGAALTGLTAYQFVFFDANNDGITDLLLTNGSTLLLFANRGTAFKEVSVPALVSSAWSSVKPVVLDSSGNGNTEITYVQGSAAYAIDLDAPGVGLLASADDGRGTVLTFGYQRAPAEVGVRYRNSLLAQMQVASTGYDVVTYQYSFQGPELHSVGQFLLGYDQVERQGALALSTATFSNTDDASGMLLSSVEQDALEPNAEKVDYRTYVTSSVKGVPWRQLVTESGGWSRAAPAADAGALTEMLEETQYASYADSVCPSQIVKTSSAGTLTTTKTFYVTLFPNALTCLDEHVTMVGSHPDGSLNFAHEAQINRNAVGLVTNVTMYQPATGNGSGMPLDVQDVTYAADENIETVSEPGRGTSSYAFAGTTGLLASVTTPDGVLTAVTNRDPLSDAVLELTVDRGSLLYVRDFTFDGQERLSTSWNNLGTATAAAPDETDTYRYASGATPALTQTTSLATLSWGAATDGGAPQPVATYARSAGVFGADGKALATARLIPQGWMLGDVTQRSRATRTETKLVGLTVPDVTALAVSALYSGAQPLDLKQASIFDLPANEGTTYQAGVTRNLVDTLGVAVTGALRTEVENGALSTTWTLDEEGRVTSYADQAGTATGYVYDALGRARRVHLPDGTTHAIDYDDYGQVSDVVREGIATLKYAYDPTTGLLTERDVVAAAGTTTAGSIWQRNEYTYDAVGRVSVETDVDRESGASQSFQFYYDGATPSAPMTTNARGLLTTVAGTGYTRTMTYRADGVEAGRVVTLAGWRTIENATIFDEDGAAHRSTLTILDGSGNVLATDVSMTVRDAYGRLSGVLRDSAPFASYAYDPNGLPLTASFSGPYSHDEIVTLAYDPATRLRVGLTQSNSSWAASINQMMSARGLIASETIDVSSMSISREFAYTPQGFLATSTDATAAYSYAYAPDGLPAQIVSSVGGATDTRTLARNGKVLTAGTHTETFDDVGRVVERDGVIMTYGGNGQVASALSTTELSYLYDEKGNRVAKLVNGAPVAAYLPDGAYLDESSITIPVRFADQLVATMGMPTCATSAAKALHLVGADLTGTVLADEDGTPRIASPFGDRTTQPDLAAAVDYAEKGYDPDLGMVRMGARDYDPTFNRFSTPDPLYLADPGRCVGKPTECNLYSYARNAPLDFVDPTGRDTLVLHGGFIGKAIGVDALAETASSLFATGTPVIVPTDVHASHSGEWAVEKTEPFVAAAYAGSYEHPPGSEKNLAGFSLGGDAAMIAAAHTTSKWDNVVVVGARVDGIMANLESAAMNSVHLVIVNLHGDNLLGDRKYESLVGAIQARYGSMAEFGKAFPNVAIESAVGSHFGAGNSESTQKAVIQGYQEVTGKN